ncbi:hypothetical protein FRC08_001414 [Ceratobasidium sp. 394]|nr:hypothetical protein FRC08_001414 [Ceratobasidium sp. 394]KAG9089665.1 hypothetical protein FS749_001148 [Ceratobasidium sp. UAMH 11750]
MIHQNLSVCITDSHGTQLEEYKTNDVDDKTVECWIPSDEGANFRIIWKPAIDPRPNLSLRCDIRLDGRTVSAEILSAAMIMLGIPGETDGAHIASSVKRLFVFGRRNLTDQDELASPNDPGKDLGTIQVRLTWVHWTSTDRIYEYIAPKEPGLVHERAAKKGHSATATLADPIHVNPEPLKYAVRTDTVSPPVVFTFRYGPKDWLKAKNIMPHESPEPTVIGSGRDTPVIKTEEPSRKRKREPSSTPTVVSSQVPQKLLRTFDPSEVIDIDDSESDTGSDVVVLDG